MANKRDAYKLGVRLGFDFVWENSSELSEDNDAVSIAFDVFENYQQYSPWEQVASEWNDCGDRADGLWSAFNDGLAVGARKAAKEVNA